MLMYSAVCGSPARLGSRSAVDVVAAELPLTVGTGGLAALEVADEIEVGEGVATERRVAFPVAFEAVEEEAADDALSVSAAHASSSICWAAVLLGFLGMSYIQ